MGAIQLVTVIVAYRLLPIESVGLMALARLATGLGEQFREMGSRHAIVQRESLTPSFLNGAFAVNLAIGLLLALGVALAGWPMAWFYDHPELASMLAVLSVIFLINSLGQVNRALLTREMRFDLLALIEVAGVLAGGIVIVSAAASGWDVWSLVFGEIAIVTVSTIAVWIARPWRPGLRTSRQDLDSIARFGMNLVGFNLANYLFQNADRLIIGRVLGTDALGLYSFAQRVVLLPMRTLSSTLSNVLIPSFSQRQGQDEWLRNRYRRALSGTAAVTFPLLVGFACVAQDFISVYDVRWKESALVIACVTPAGLVQSLTRSIGAVLIAKGRPDLLLQIGTAVGLVTLVGYAVGVSLGILGVAVGFSVAMTLCLVPSFSVVFGLLGGRARDLWTAVRPVCIATIALLVGALVLDALLSAQPPLIRMACVIPGAAAAYGLVLRWLAPEILADLMLILGRRRGVRGDEPEPG